MHPAAAPIQTRAHASAGFTLLEMLVALSILALAALALVRLDAFTVRSTADLSLNALAAITAENVAAQMVSEPGAPSGDNTVTVQNGGAAFQVATRTSALDTGLIRIDIAVTGPQGVRAALTTVRAAQ